MGGKASEEVALAETTSNAEGDLKHATKLAYNMVCKWGMSVKIGALSVDTQNEGGFMDYYKSHSVSDKLRNEIDSDVIFLLKKMLYQSKKNYYTAS